MIFLTVVTRCYKRPEMLANNKKSLANQTSQDYKQVFLVDRIGRGVGAANRALKTAPIVGEYVLVLDDDDMLIHDRAIELLKQAAADSPALVIFKADHDYMGILPDDLVWERRPLRGHIGSCSFITRRDVWERHIHRYGIDEAGDYAFLHSVWMDRPRVVWLDEVFAGVQRISKGRPA